MSDAIYKEFERCADRLFRHKVVDRAELQPCSDDDLGVITAHAGRRLPAAYEHFLRRMGRGAGHFMASEAVFYPKVLDLRRIAEELVAENSGELSLPPDAFVISVHQGYEYQFFVHGEGEDPPVYQCYEGHVGIAFVWPSFTAFFCDVVGQYVD
jgi:hypothetical protein